MDMETDYSNDSSDTVSDTSSKKSFKSGVTVELFEGYDDAIWGDGGRAWAVTRNRNASKNSPDATWSGTVTLLYHQRLGTGFDYRDTSNSLCTGKDCAVGDDHEVFFPLDEFEDDESNDSSKNETTPSSNPSSGKQPAKIFIGVYNSRAVAQPGWLGGTLSRHESLRFQSPLEYVLTATAGSKATPVCFQNCSGRGSCCVSQIPTLFGPITLTVYSYTLRKTDTFLFQNKAFARPRSRRFATAAVLPSARGAASTRSNYRSTQSRQNYHWEKATSFTSSSPFRLRKRASP